MASRSSLLNDAHIPKHLASHQQGCRPLEQSKTSRSFLEFSTTRARRGLFRCDKSLDVPAFYEQVPFVSTIVSNECHAHTFAVAENDGERAVYLSEHCVSRPGSCEEVVDTLSEATIGVFHFNLEVALYLQVEFFQRSFAARIDSACCFQRL